MELVSGIVVYIVLWWVIIFTVLPFGTHREANPEVGHDHGAPVKTHLRLKLLVTTILATICWFIADYIIIKMSA